MQLPVLDAEGNQVDVMEVDDLAFGIKPNRHVLHQVLVAQRANLRSGTADTKERGEVRGSTRKIRPQKYTGRARQGSIRAPHHVGGGIVFGPHPRSYYQKVPKRVRNLGIRSALSAKVQAGQLKVLNELQMASPNTTSVLATVRRLGVERSALIVTGEPDRNVFLSARNLPRTKTLPAAYINVLDLLSHNDVVMTVAAVRKAEELWGGERALLRRVTPGERVQSA